MLVISVLLVGSFIAAMIYFSIKREKFTAITYDAVPKEDEESGVLPLNQEKEHDVEVEIGSFDKNCELNYSKV